MRYYYITVLFLFIILRLNASHVYQVGNVHLNRTLILTDDRHLKPGGITNNHTGGEIPLENGSNEFIIALTDGSMIESNNLIYETMDEKEYNDGKLYTFSYSDYTINNYTFKIKLHFDVSSNSHYIYKYIEIAIPEYLLNSFKIDYIDTECLKINDMSKYTTWSHPNWSGPDFQSYWATLGQPVYINGCFLGSEFPYTDNYIENNIYRSRYYCGKSFKELEGDGLLTSNGSYVTWKNVIGAADSDNLSSVRESFFKYVDYIKRPSKMTFNFNSWYDWEQTISSENILSSFTDIENGFTKSGLRPLDSYVVDDGWNAYGDFENENTTQNISGFWEFNSKFPNGLDEAKLFADSKHTHLGLWISPKGGWAYCNQMADVLESSGYGLKSSMGDGIITGDSVYIHHLTDFMLDVQRKYELNYWKIDGFSQFVPQDTKTGRYTTGGYNGMYYVTEHWERWLKVLKTLYADAESRGVNLWINLTCRAKPSPWFLPYCNSIWIQYGEDQADLMIDNRDIKLEKQLNYRDNIYFENTYDRQFQFPAYAYFHHDPSFGKIRFSPDCANDEEFRFYLYMIAMRGSYLWDMLYSVENLSEGNKLDINKEVLQWAEENQDVLKNALIFGNRPSSGGCYGYSAWDAKKELGFIILRNPSSKQRSFQFKLNNDIGVPSTVKHYSVNKIMDYYSDKTTMPQEVSYGDIIDINLGPGQTVLYKFGANNNLSSLSQNGSDKSMHYIIFDNNIDLLGVDGDKAELYSINGSLISCQPVQNHFCRLFSGRISSGLYLIRCGSNTIKVNLK